MIRKTLLLGILVSTGMAFSLDVGNNLEKEQKVLEHRMKEMNKDIEKLQYQLNKLQIEEQKLMNIRIKTVNALEKKKYDLDQMKTRQTLVNQELKERYRKQSKEERHQGKKYFEESKHYYIYNININTLPSDKFEIVVTENNIQLHSKQRHHTERKGAQFDSFSSWTITKELVTPYRGGEVSSKIENNWLTVTIRK
jgi:broad specificity polyphosphatase/5'/3'-nucleotidase SurE